jgi:hypothetical protein
MLTSIVQAVNAILAEYDFPLTLRQIYYRLVSTNLVPNKRSAYNQLSKTLVKARENGEVDDTRIEDRARQVLRGEPGCDGPKQFTEIMEDWFRGSGKRYHADLWSNQPVFVEVWVEKDALSRVIAQAAEPYRVTVCPSRGYSSYTYLKRMAIDDRLSDVDKPIIILDFRDHDPSGIQMTEDLQRRLTKYGGGIDVAAETKNLFGVDFNDVLKDLLGDSGIPAHNRAEALSKFRKEHPEASVGLNITVHRVALTIDQVKQYNLIPNPAKLADPRSQAYVAQYGDQCWELDAIEPRELQRLVKDAIEERLDLEVWANSLEQEGKDRTSLIESFANATIGV